MSDGLLHIADQIQGWLDWQAVDRAKQRLTTDGETFVIAIPAKTWPTRMQLELWVHTLRNAASLLGAADTGLSFRDMTKDLPRSEPKRARFDAVTNERIEY